MSEKTGKFSPLLSVVLIMVLAMQGALLWLNYHTNQAILLKLELISLQTESLVLKQENDLAEQEIDRLRQENTAMQATQDQADKELADKLVKQGIARRANQ